MKMRFCNLGPSFFSGDKLACRNTSVSMENEQSDRAGYAVEKTKLHAPLDFAGRVGLSCP